MKTIKKFKDMQPYEWIESISETQLKNALVLTGAAYEMETIKGYKCYFFNFESLEEIKKGVSYFGYSVMVFKNKKQLNAAADHQLHHRNKNTEELKQYYIDQLNGRIEGQFDRAIYTEEEIIKNDLVSYKDYELKNNFIRNIYKKQFTTVSPFYIGEPDEEQTKAKNEYYYSSKLFTYFENMEDLKKCESLINLLDEKYIKMLDDELFFAKAVRYELQNHESCYSYEYDSALAALGLKFNQLTKKQKNIVIDQFNKELYRTDI